MKSTSKHCRILEYIASACTMIGVSLISLKHPAIGQLALYRLRFSDRTKGSWTVSVFPLPDRSFRRGQLDKVIAESFYFLTSKSVEYYIKAE